MNDDAVERWAREGNFRAIEGAVLFRALDARSAGRVTVSEVLADLGGERAGHDVRVAIKRATGNLADAGLLDPDGLAAELVEATGPALRYNELLESR